VHRKNAIKKNSQRPSSSHKRVCRRDWVYKLLYSCDKAILSHNTDKPEILYIYVCMCITKQKHTSDITL